MFFAISFINALLISQIQSLPTDDSNLEKRQTLAAGTVDWKSMCDLNGFKGDMPITSDSTAGCIQGADLYCNGVNDWKTCAAYWKGVYGVSKYVGIYDSCAQYSPSYNEAACKTAVARNCGMTSDQVGKCEDKIAVISQRTGTGACAIACNSYKSIFRDSCPYGFTTDSTKVCK